MVVSTDIRKKKAPVRKKVYTRTKVEQLNRGELNMILKIETIEEITISDTARVRIWIDTEQYVELEPEISVRLATFFNKAWGLIAPPEDEGGNDVE